MNNDLTVLPVVPEEAEIAPDQRELHPNLPDVYKGQLMAEQVATFYDDLRDPDMASAFAYETITKAATYEAEDDLSPRRRYQSLPPIDS